MKIVGHIHTYNDEEAIDGSLAALRSQSRSPDRVIIVDNQSTDGTLDRDFGDGVEILMQPDNSGTAGAVARGMRYGIENGFDWIWILDADCRPQPDALQKLAEFLEGLEPSVAEKVWLVSSLPVELPRYAVTTPFSLRLSQFEGDDHPKPRHGVIFTPNGYQRVVPSPDYEVYEIHGTIWSGSLFRLDAVKQIGLPNEHYFLDFDDYSFDYRAMRLGWRAFMHQGSINHQNSTGKASFSFPRYGIGPVSFKLLDLAPIRCYYVTRNTLYFWLYEYHVRNIHTLAPRIYKVLMLTLNFLIRPVSRRRELAACVIGIFHGVTKRIDRRYWGAAVTTTGSRR